MTEQESSVKKLRVRKTIEFDADVWDEFQQRFPGLSPWVVLNEMLRHFLTENRKGIDMMLQEAGTSYDAKLKELLDISSLNEDKE